MKRCIVVIPAYNEEMSIAKVIAKVPRTLSSRRFTSSVGSADRAAEEWKVEILVVNDGSKDETSAAAEAAGADYIYSSTRNRGLGAAVYFGLKQARRLGADAAVMIDADDEYPAEEIPQVVYPIMIGEADYVIGSRFMRKVRGMKLHRRLGNRVFTWLQSLLLRKRIIDGQSGFRAFHRDALQDLDIIHDYNYAQVMTLNLVRQGYRLLEVPISYKTRTTGESFIKWNYVAKVLPAMVREMMTPPNRGREAQPSYRLEMRKRAQGKGGSAATQTDKAIAHLRY